MVGITMAQRAPAIDYGHLMAKKVKEALGSRSNGYTFATYPIDNFGLATAYEDKVDPSRALCATWDCIGVSGDMQVEAMSAKEQLKLKVSTLQYATTGDGPSLKLSDDEKNSIGLKALLPHLFQVLSLSFDLSISKNITTTLTMGPVTIRVLRRKEMLDHLRSEECSSAGKSCLRKAKIDTCLFGYCGEFDDARLETGC
jgi:hypothetical protein